MGSVTCTMCEAEPATANWGLPVCQPCFDWLTQLHGELGAMDWDGVTGDCSICEEVGHFADDCPNEAREADRFRLRWRAAKAAARARYGR